MTVLTQPKPTGAREPPLARATSKASIELYWLPLGAGGWFVRLNGRIYEAIHAFLERRRPLDLYHSALEVRLPEGRFVIENSWPIPDADPASRGVVVQGPVASRRIARFRVFRYEVRRWRDGVIADADEAVASPQPLSDDPRLARRLLDLVGSLPSPVWGRDELGTGEMWNSNSVISWLLARSGLPTNAIRPPAGGRAPGWQAGLVTAHRQQASDERAGHGAGGAAARVGGWGDSSGLMHCHSCGTVSLIRCHRGVGLERLPCTSELATSACRRHEQPESARRNSSSGAVVEGLALCRPPDFSELRGGRRRGQGVVSLPGRQTCLLG
jgi:hypothetical protein